MIATGESRGRSLKGLTIKAAVFLGFALTVAVWAWSGYQQARQIAELEEESRAISERYKGGQQLLSTVRTQLLVGSVYVRDALLDPDVTSAESYRRQIEDNYRTIDEALQRYIPVFDPVGEGNRIKQLRRDIDDFRATMLAVLAIDSRQWPTNARGWLNDLIVPRREAVMRASEDLAALNGNNYVEQQAAIAAINRTTQRQVARRFGVALALSFAIGVIAVLYAGRLEKEIKLQTAREVETSRSLQRLSSQLVHVQEEERRHLSRELHDEVGQILTAVKVELALAQRAIDAAGGPALALQNARTMTDVALNTVRDLSHLLHPALLDDLGLQAAIDGYLRSFGERHGIGVQLLCDRMDERLVPEIEVAAYRIVQEALTNVGKHAHAKMCRVHLQKLSNAVMITVEDDGVGFDQKGTRQAVTPAGLGLIGIRERISELGGTLQIEAAIGEGTRLTAELPARMRVPIPLDVQEQIIELEPSVE
jgi:signal transduction histidine kinase